MSQFVFPPLTANLNSEGTNGGSLPSSVLVVAGYDGANIRAIKTDSTGEVAVDVSSIGTVTVTGTVAVSAIAGALPAGSNAIGKLAANSGVDIGDVDVTSLPSIPAGTNSIGTVILGAGTAAIGKLSANSGVDIGDVDVTSLPSLPAGTNAIGKLVANSGVDIGDVDVTSIVPGTGATNLGKAIQSAQGTTDTGVPALVVRNDTLADLAGADHDYAPLQVNASGALYVEVKTSGLPSGAATEAKQDTIETTLTAIETDADTIAGAVSGTEMQVDVVASLPAGSNNIGDVDIASALPAGTNSIGTVILGAGTAAIGKLSANSGVDIGDVDVTSLPALPAGSNTIGKVDVNAIAPVDFLCHIAVI